MILGVHLKPALGHRKLDAIKSEDVQRLKRELEVKAPKTVNNILAVLSVLLKKAVEWEVIERMPCSIQLLPVPKDRQHSRLREYERRGAGRFSTRKTYLLLGGEADRCGEMMAMEWSRGFGNRQVCSPSEGNGHENAKGGAAARAAHQTMAAAIGEHRH